MFSRGDTDNIEGFSLPEEKKNLKLFKPDNINDLAVMYAFDRPYCLETMAIIFDNKANNTPCETIDCLKPILEQTYGCFVFEEQLMQAVTAFCSCSLAEANILRNILRKKKKNMYEEYLEKFTKMGLERGYRKEDCEKLFYNLETVSGKLFSKSHAIEVATVIYKVGYIKCHYSELFEKLTKEFESVDLC